MNNIKEKKKIFELQNTSLITTAPTTPPPIRIQREADQASTINIKERVKALNTQQQSPSSPPLITLKPQQVLIDLPSTTVKARRAVFDSTKQSPSSTSVANLKNEATNLPTISQRSVKSRATAIDAAKKKDPNLTTWKPTTHENLLLKPITERNVSRPSGIRHKIADFLNSPLTNWIMLTFPHALLSSALWLAPHYIKLISTLVNPNQLVLTITSGAVFTTLTLSLPFAFFTIMFSLGGIFHLMAAQKVFCQNQVMPQYPRIQKFLDTALATFYVAYQISSINELTQNELSNSQFLHELHFCLFKVGALSLLLYVSTNLMILIYNKICKTIDYTLAHGIDILNNTTFSQLLQGQLNLSKKTA